MQKSEYLKNEKKMFQNGKRHFSQLWKASNDDQIDRKR